MKEEGTAVGPERWKSDSWQREAFQWVALGKQGNVGQNEQAGLFSRFLLAPTIATSWHASPSCHQSCTSPRSPTLLPRPQPHPLELRFVREARECLREAGRQMLPTPKLGDLGRGAGQRSQGPEALPHLPCHH